MREKFFGKIPGKGLQCGRNCAIIPYVPGVAQLVARLTGGQEAGSSSLFTRTTPAASKSCAGIFFFGTSNTHVMLASFSRYASKLDKSVFQGSFEPEKSRFVFFFVLQVLKKQ